MHCTVRDVFLFMLHSLALSSCVTYLPYLCETPLLPDAQASSYEDRPPSHPVGIHESAGLARPPHSGRPTFNILSRVPRRYALSNQGFFSLPPPSCYGQGSVSGCGRHRMGGGQDPRMDRPTCGSSRFSVRGTRAEDVKPTNRSRPGALRLACRECLFLHGRRSFP
jgi:hypothetical protein